MGRRPNIITKQSDDKPYISLRYCNKCHHGWLIDLDGNCPECGKVTSRSQPDSPTPANPPE